MRRRISLLLVPGLIAAGLFGGSPAVAQTEPPPSGPITVRAGYGEADATWHVGAGAGQYSDKKVPIPPEDESWPEQVFTSVGEEAEEPDPHGHAVTQKRSYGVHSRLSYRAIVVEDAQGDQVAFVKSDSYLAQDYLLRRAGQILAEKGSAISYDEVFHMASHNHSSPYYMTPSAGVWIFQDAFDIRAFEYHARAMAQAIMNAETALKPARMGATTVEHNLFKGMIQRKGTADDGTPRGYPDDFGDLGLSVIRFDNMEDPSNPKPIATMINWGQHPEGLDGHDLITGDFVASLERFVERDTGAPLVFGQGDVGSAEAGPGRPDLVSALGIFPRWSHAGHAQAERGAFLLSRDVVAGWEQIVDGTPLVAVSSAFDVAAGNAWVAGPYSHPYPSVANCRTETTVEGEPGVTGPPECMRGGGFTPDDQLWEKLKDAGVQLPDNYDLPSYAGLEENTRLHLQAFKMGEVIVASCACEAQVDLILNFESRANEIQGDQWDGFDWTSRMHCVPNANNTWTCTKKAGEPRPNAVQGSFTVSDYRYQRMLAQIHNPADGWDALENVPKALSEPADPGAILGNFSREELGPDTGYKLAIGVGHASDYNGYTVSYREYQSWDDYRKSLTSYGPHTADYMVTRMVRLAGTLNGVPNEELELDIQRGLPDEARQVAMSTALGAASFATYEAWINSLPNDKGPAAIETQPEDIKRFDAATFSWVGGSNAADNPIVKVQRLDEDGTTWVDFADQSGEVQTKVEFPDGVNAFADTHSGNQEWLWTANFEAFNAFPAEIGSTPEGEYRFVVDGLIRQGTPSENEPYHHESRTFTVSGWDGITVSELRSGDGDVSFEVPSIDYPASYDSVFPKYISTTVDGFCEQCSFRPWATSGTLESAQITIVHADGGHSKRPADCEGNTCTAPVGPDETAYIAQGDIVDNYGETNSQCYDFTGGNECPPAENDLDTDDDGTFDDADNCIDVANPDQLDADKDAAGDACDEDDTDGPDPDADGIHDRDDNCDAEPNTNQSDIDGDEVGDACDPDSSDGPLADPDGDGINNLDEQTGNSDPRDACAPNEAAANCDVDDDGFVNATDNCDQNANPSQTDSDNDGIGDPCDSTPRPPATGGGDTGGGTGGGGADGGGAGGGQSSPPASSPPASNSPAAPQRGTASTSIAASVVTTDHGEDFALSGVVSGDRTCTFTNVEILKRTYGTDELSSVATAQVAPDGSWSATQSSATNASYAARPAATDLCDGQTSSPVDVLVRAKVIPQTMRCHVTSTLRGRVAPNLADTKVVLQRRSRGAWKRIDVARLNDRSRFVFRDVPRGCRPTRVVWLKQHIGNERGVASVSFEG